MYIEHDGNHWWINKAPSCFVSRTGKQDVSIYKRSPWGRRQPDGKLYKCCLRLAAEDGGLLRDYEAIPLHITVEWLKQAGFIAHNEGPLIDRTKEYLMHCDKKAQEMRDREFEDD